MERAGFDVEVGVAGLDMAFVATYGQGSPVPCTFAEYEAVESCSQMPVPYKHPVIVGKGGTYDMHHGNAAGSLGAAMAVKHVMEKNHIPGSHFPSIGSMISKEHVDYGKSSVPGIAKAHYVSRALTRKDNERIQERIFDCANAAALALRVKVKNEVVTGTWEPIPNRILANAVHKNVEAIGPPKYT